MTPRRGASPACSTNSAASCRCCAQRPIRRAACCKAWSRAACMPRWRRLPPIISLRRWRRSRAPSPKRFSARWCGAARLERAYVNNGGDIALHLADGERFTVGLIDRPDRPGLMRTTVIDADDPSRGIATSGRHGRSFSLGIADAVTVLARTASQADAAATIIANAVDLPGHPAIVRCPAHDLQPDSDLGARLVTRGVGRFVERRDCGGARCRRGGARQAARCRIDRRRRIAACMARPSSSAARAIEMRRIAQRGHTAARWKVRCMSEQRNEAANDERDHSQDRHGRRGDASGNGAARSRRRPGARRRSP